MQSYDDKIVWDLEICKNINLLKYASNIMLYGAGWKGKDVFCRLKRAGIYTSFFVDMDMGKWSGYIENVKIISPFEIKYTEFDHGECIYMIACINHPEEVLDLLKCMQLSNVRILTYWGIRMALYVNRKHLYDRCTEEMALLNMEKERRKNRFLDVGYSFIYSVLSSLESAVWIIQPGKTASTTLGRRLERGAIPYIAIHKLEYPQNLMGNKYKNIWEESIERRKKEPLKIIIAVREPITRDYSAFWQAFSEGNEMAMEMPILDKDFQKTYDEYLNMLLKGNRYMKDRLGASIIFCWGDEFEWFDEQIKKYLDIDVFKHPFDREKGYTIIRSGNIELLLYKVEKMENISNEIGLFLGTTKLPEINDNVAEKKWYGLAYKQFRKEVKIPKKYVDHYYCGNDKMDYFYTTEEKKRFLNEWKENIELD